PKPFKRILSTHAQVSIKDAVALNWMSAVDAQRYDLSAVSSNSGSGSWDDATSIQQVSGSKYKANDLTRQQFLGCVAKHTPPEFKIVPYSGLRNSAYEKELNAGHTNRAAVLRPPPGMKIQHLPEGIRVYVSRNPADFKDYLDEISAETKYLSTISRLVKKENGPDARNRIRRRILQAAENSGDITDE
ncbi:hypothetical protein PROFUN_14660, partial [Planoprotostelium fungivorum]